MGSCQLCGSEITPAFQCSRCGHEFCADHRLPENHQCSEGRGSSDQLGGDGPRTSRLKETGRHGNRNGIESPEPRSPRSKGDYRERSDTGNEACPSCGEQVASLSACSECGERYCTDCVRAVEHECPVGMVASNGGTPDNAGLLDRLKGLLF